LPDNENAVAFTYGPIVLSAGLGTQQMVSTSHLASAKATIPAGVTIKETIAVDGATPLEDFVADIHENLVQTPGELEFTLRNTDEDDLQFTPQYLRYEDRYGIYFRLTGEQGATRATGGMPGEIWSDCSAGASGGGSAANGGMPNAGGTAGAQGGATATGGVGGVVANGGMGGATGGTAGTSSGGLSIGTAGNGGAPAGGTAMGSGALAGSGARSGGASPGGSPSTVAGAASQSDAPSGASGCGCKIAEKRGDSAALAGVALLVLQSWRRRREPRGQDQVPRRRPSRTAR
jgi:MYXO-CTERM domain-containing protein